MGERSMNTRLPSIFVVVILCLSAILVPVKVNAQLTSFDWRNKDGSNWMTGIKNQGCNDCWAFASCAALEAKVRIHLNKPNWPVDLSEQYVVSCFKGDCNPWFLDSTLDGLRDTGTPYEVCFPYQLPGTVPPCSDSCSEYKLTLTKATSWAYVGNDRDAIKTALEQHGPLPTWMQLYTDFDTYSGGVYQHVSGTDRGGHFVVIVGWNDAENCWICKNSWGTNWGEDTYGLTGERGWFRIAYGQCGIDDNPAYIEDVALSPMDNALQWLSNQQNLDGSWTYSGRITEESIGITAMASACYSNFGVDTTDPNAKKAIEWILSKQNPDGSITTGTYYVYDTSLAILALVAAGRSEYYEKIKSATNYLIGLQNDEDTDYQSSDIYYGGWSYFPDYHWADLSNSQFVLLALYTAEKANPNDKIVSDDVWSKAEIFVQRCQNREDSNPDYNFYDDGGFLYQPASTTWASGHSYGSMTAAGIWGFVTVGVDTTDPRVTDALNWLTTNYRIDENYPIGNQFLYYYLYALAKAYVLTDTSTVNSHAWYQEMEEFLLSRQQSDGHWIGTDASEEPDNVATCWAILALETRAEPIVERTLTLRVESPADLHVYCPQGKHVGMNYTTGTVDLEIPDTTYSGLGTEPQVISIHNPMSGTWRIELVGRTTGMYTLTIEGAINSTEVYSESHTGNINRAELYSSEATVSSVSGALTIWTTPPKFEKVLRMATDVNDDGRINMIDIAVVAQAFGSYPTHPRWNPWADVNSDSKVNLRDVGLIAKDLGKEY